MEQAKYRLQIVCHLLCQRKGENGKMFIYLRIYAKRNTGSMNQNKENGYFQRMGRNKLEDIKEGLTILSVFFSIVLTFGSMLNKILYFKKLKIKSVRLEGKN